MYEVIAIREGWLMLGNHNFSRGEMGEIISFMVTRLAESVLIVTDRAIFVLLYLFFLLLFYNVSLCMMHNK